MFSKYFSFFFIPVLAALVPYLACQFFDSPLLHGIFSAEEFFLLLALALPYGKILWKLPFAVAIFGYAFYANIKLGFCCVFVVLFSCRLRKFLLFHVCPETFGCVGACKILLVGNGSLCRFACCCGRFAVFLCKENSMG